MFILTIALNFFAAGLILGMELVLRMYGLEGRKPWKKKGN